MRWMADLFIVKEKDSAVDAYLYDVPDAFVTGNTRGEAMNLLNQYIRTMCSEGDRIIIDVYKEKENDVR